VSIWYGLFAPAGTPQAIVARLNAEINKALEAPDTKEKLAAQGFDWKRGTPADFAAFLKSETAKWAKAVKDSGAKAE